MDAGGGGPGSTVACGRRTHDAMDVSYCADFAMAVVSDAVFYGGEQPLPIFEQRGEIIREKKMI
jgi:hypothetical protein